MSSHQQVNSAGSSLSDEAGYAASTAGARSRPARDGAASAVARLLLARMLASVGMLEHVGTHRYQELGRVIDRVLTNHGRGLIHSIGRDYPRPMDAWTERHIFPEACPPSLSQMMAISEPCGFSVLDVENLRLHYAKTLEHWLARVEAASAMVAEMFSPAVARTWRLYLAGSLAAFRSGNMQLFRVVFSRAGNSCIPWTRHAPQVY